MSKILSSLVLLALIPNAAVAQIIPDSSLGAENSVVDTNGNRDTINGGAVRDANLFHSFQEFNVGAGREAYFANPNGIANIFSRVTGNNISNILGTLGVLGDANLFFINPNGIVFGANARLDVRGSFLGSTADSLLFGNGFEFSASNPQAPPLLTIGIPIGLNFRDNPGDIVNQSVANNGNGLEVATGESITLIGGNVDLDGGKIFAGGARVELGGLSAAGEIGINADASLSFPNGVARADITLTNGSEVDVRAAGGGSISVNARNIKISGGELGASNLVAGIAIDSGSPEAQAGDIIFNATDNITVTQGSFISNSVEEFGVGNAGNVEITANDLVKFDGEDREGGESGAVSLVFSGADGQAGGVFITTSSLEVTNGAFLDASTFGLGDAGSVTINATDSVKFDGLSKDGFSSGAFSVVFSGADGQAGGVFITTSSLEVTNGAFLSTSTSGLGDAGSITINATDSVKFDAEGGFSGAFSQILSGADGQAGGVFITTSSLEVTNGAQVGASTSGIGDGGNITINATDSVKLDGSRILSPSGVLAISGLFSLVQLEAEGKAEDVFITTSSLKLTNGAVLATRTSGFGNAGNIILNVKDNITLSGSDTGIFADTTESSTGQGGNIIIDPSINPRNLTIQDGATISVDSQGTGIGGDIELSAGLLTLDNGTISAETRSNTGGNITLNLQDLLLLSNGSQITTNAGNRQFGGNGGNITINTPFIVAFPNENSDITANAFEGRGGQINITAQGIFGIEERRASEGNTNDIDASSELGASGQVETNNTIDPNQGLIQLPETVVDPNALVANNPCKRGSESEFVITGRGGLPPSLSEDLSSDATQVGLVEPAPMENRGAIEQESREAEDKTSSSSSVPTPIIPARGWVFNEKGEVVLVAYDPTVTGPQRLKENPPVCPTP